MAFVRFQTYNFVVRFSLAAALLLVAAANSLAQTGSTEPIIIKLPDNVASDAVSIWYNLSGQASSSGGFVQRHRNVRQYVIYTTLRGGPARESKVVVYAPGCRFKTYEIDLNRTTRVEKQFECEPLPTRTIRGFLSPAEIPKSVFSNGKQFDIKAELEANWMCGFFLRQQNGTQTLAGGSCLVPSIPLGTVGGIEPENGGTFEIAIPDFTLDPVFNSYAGSLSAAFGEIELGLFDKKVDRPVGGVKARDFAGPRQGWAVETSYPDVVVFERVR